MRRYCLAAISTFVIAASPLGAQLPGALPPLRDSVLAGIVTDPNGRVVDSAQIIIVELRRTYRTMPDGAFWFDSVPAGEYEVQFRKIGWKPSNWNVVTRPGGTALFLQVERLPQMLEPVITTANRVGVFGMVLDTADKPLRNVQVTLNGGRKERTDEHGRFFISTPQAGGRYLLHARLEGYATRMMSVTVKPDSGQEVVMWLTPTTRGQAAREAFVMESFRARMLTRNPVWSKVFTRDDLSRLGFDRVEQMVVAGSGQSIPANVDNAFGQCVAVVDGLYATPLWAIDPKDIEFAEVYGNRPSRPKRGNLRSGPRVDVFGPRGCPAVHVWLRQ